MARHRTAWAMLGMTLLLLVVGDLYAAGGGPPAPELNNTEIATTLHAEINDARTAQGRPRLSSAPALATTAGEHSAWMAETERLDHSESGVYACDYAGENIAYTYANGDIRVADGEVVDLNYNETKIAQRLAQSWLNSPRHRENLMDRRFTAEGIGIAVAEVDGRQRVYATQALCDR